MAHGSVASVTHRLAVASACRPRMVSQRYPRRMIDPWMLWMLLVGLAIGLLAAWLLLARLPREESDITFSERRAEASWIGRTIEYHGGIAPQTLVEEVLQLHEAYLNDPSLWRPAPDDVYDVPAFPPLDAPRQPQDLRPEPPPLPRSAPPPPSAGN